MFTSKVSTDAKQAITGVEFSRKTGTWRRHITSYRQLRVKDLPNVPSLHVRGGEEESNQRPSAPKEPITTQPTTPQNFYVFLFSSGLIYCTKPTKFLNKTTFK